MVVGRLSRVGFGCLRVVRGNAFHEQSLRLALEGGVNVVDTCPTAPGADEVVRQALAEQSKANPSKHVHVLSKHGFIVGKLLQDHAQGKLALQDVEKIGNALHSIHPSLLDAQLSANLETLGVSCIDVLFLHNPEVAIRKYISSPDDPNIPAARDAISDRFRLAFRFLEEKRAQGTVKGYGISSNGFSLPPSHPHHLPFHNLLDIAAEVAAEVGNKDPGLHALQMPINLVEQEALHGAARWASSHGLVTFANRPLNALLRATDPRSNHDSDRLLRLASYPFPDNFEAVLAQYLGDSDIVDAGFTDAIREMNHRLTQLTSVADIGSMLERVFAPRIALAYHKAQQNTELDEAVRQRAKRKVHEFVRAFDQHAKRRCELATRAELARIGESAHAPEDQPLQNSALGFLLGREEVGCVLVGMRQPGYVTGTLALARGLPVA